MPGQLLASALDHWTALRDPAIAELAGALHRGWVGKKRCPTRDNRHDIRRALRDLTAPTRLDKLVQTHRCVMMVLGNGDPSVPHRRQVASVYARVALIVLTIITARAYRLGSRVIKRTEGFTLNVGLASITVRLAVRYHRTQSSWPRTGGARRKRRGTRRGRGLWHDVQPSAEVSRAVPCGTKAIGVT